MERESPKDIILELSLSKYQGADSILWGGSTQQGNHTDKSDLECVVIYPHVDRPYRESFVFKGWPVDCFGNNINFV